MKHTIELDDYEVANLKWLLQLVNDFTKFNPLNSGDWVGQIREKLPMVDHRPNKSIEDIVFQFGINDPELIDAARYGYNYHKDTQFPEMEFEEAPINNFRQFLQAKNLKQWQYQDKQNRQ